MFKFTSIYTHQQPLMERNPQNIDDGDVAYSAFTKDDPGDVKMHKVME